MDVPTTADLSAIYTQDALNTQTKRWTNLLSTFSKIYGRDAEFIARSPGRVNIIGEHIDYSLYEVIPMAIEADVLIAVAVRSNTESANTITLHNTNPRFESKTFTIPESGDIDIDSTALEWTNYFKSGLRGATELLRKKLPDFKRSISMDVLADGSVPAGGGLSSSAAFVCASSLAVLRGNGLTEINKKELVEIAIVSERSVGVNSGGMDQSASVFPTRGSALYVSFVPELNVKSISFPELKSPLTFVIAQSFVAADKHVTGPECYNLRVVECTLAALVLSKIFGLRNLPADAGPLGQSLRGFHDAYYQEKEGVANNHDTSKSDFQQQLEDLLTKVDSYLPQEEGYTRDQISNITGLSVPELEKRYMTKFPVRADAFKLRQRAIHVFSEASRVLKFMDLLSTHIADEQKLLTDLGALLSETQKSCREVYECSCPELDELCELARSAGAYGSRLTGAGWGGCTVHLVPEDRVEAVRQAWISEYYKKRFPDISDEKLDEAIVVSKPGSGSALFTVNGRKSL